MQTDSSALSDQQFLRYSRQILLPEIGLEKQAQLLDKTVLIVGLGGLGSIVAPYLAGAGVGRLLLADGDHVDITNLHRQWWFGSAYEPNADKSHNNKAELAATLIEQLNPDCTTAVIPRHLDNNALASWLKCVDLVIDCTDNMPARHKINAACHQANIPLVIGAAIEMKGQWAVFDYSTDPLQPCYQCLFPEAPSQASNCQQGGVLGPVVGVIASTQAMLALKLLCGMKVPTQQLHCFDGTNMQWQHFSVQADPHCPVCQTQR